jgi:predicted MPP superfamily phosphohydrolase
VPFVYAVMIKTARTEASNWLKAESAAKQTTWDRKERILKQRVAQLERELASAAMSAEARRIARPVRTHPGKPRTRTKRDVVRIIFGDVHGCKMEHSSVAALMGDIAILDPDEIVIGGDLTDCGGFLAQHHTLGYVAETEYSWEDDNAAANQFLDALSEAAPKATIEYLEGNHENRVERWIITETLRNHDDAAFLRKILGPEAMLSLPRRGIKFYARNENHGDCRQPGFVRKGKCFFVHEVSSARNAALAAINLVAGNIVFFHTHRAESVVGFRPNIGDVGGWNPGCLCVKRPMWQHTKPNDWTNGYAVQLIAPSENFLHINVPIVDGQSLLIPLTKR